jgi:long-chain acyl-CoA synthetase
MPPNVAVQLFERVDASPDLEAFRFPTAESWGSMTWREVGDRVEALAAGLVALGVEPEQRVGILSSTRYEWVLADLAVMCAAGATTTVYPTTNAEDTTYILSDSESRVVFAEDDGQIKTLKDHRPELPHVTKVVTFDGTPDGDWVISLGDLADLGAERLSANGSEIRDLATTIRPDQLATLIYTSGTTARPKGVRLRHSSWVYEGEAIKAQDILGPDDLEFRWLPMAHSLGKVLMAVQMAVGYPAAIDGRLEKIVENCGTVRPTFMGAPPRIFEKAYDKIVLMQAAEGGTKEKIFKKAFEVGLEVDRRKRKGRSVPLGMRIQHRLFDKLVFSKIRDRFGGRVRFFISGAAALNRDIALWFNAAGLLILEGYGLTESSAGSFVNLPSDNQFGTVGRVFPGSEVRLGANDEVLIKGPGVMDGYHHLPEETALALDAEGWLHTGDKGELVDGRLKLTGRIKELFKTSGGKYVAPPLIESTFKAICPYASELIVVGNEHPYCVALVILDPDAIAGWAAENGMAGASYSEIVASQPVKDMVAGYIDELNSRLNRWETIKRWALLDHDLTIESGELTPSMKVRRHVVEKNNEALIESLYA